MATVILTPLSIARGLTWRNKYYFKQAAKPVDRLTSVRIIYSQDLTDLWMPQVFRTFTFSLKKKKSQICGFSSYILNTFPYYTWVWCSEVLKGRRCSSSELYTVKPGLVCKRGAGSSSVAVASTANTSLQTVDVHV